ncbi:MAG: heme-binding protein [Pseudomonadota bacterium]|nr:heme-binding protein [Pseudomonadota bacterium]
MKYLYILLSLFIFYCGTGSSMAYEEPSFAVVQANESYEIRYYNERIVVQTNNTSQNSGFRKLFNYISGKNSNSEKIAMTVPVTQTNNLMQFYLPIKFDHENTPIPTDIDVNISTVPAGHYAVIKYGGRSSDSNFQKHAEFLRSVLSDDGIKILSEPIKATYNGPLTPSFLRRNEAIFQVQWSN